MLELIHMTAQYSNAVLVAVLPYVSDFAAKLDLPIGRPVKAKQVIWSRPSPYKDYVEAGLILSNRYWFAVGQRGFVDGFRAPTNWFFEQEFTDDSIRRYLGADHMTTNEVISMARQVLIKLGYSQELTHSYETPTLEGPYDLHRREIAGHVPYCRVIWKWPETENLVHLNQIQVEINMDARALAGLHLSFSATNHLETVPIRVDAVPELEADYQKRVRASGKMFVNTNAPRRFPQKPPDRN
jgi:hypothetical protein